MRNRIIYMFSSNEHVRVSPVTERNTRIVRLDVDKSEHDCRIWQPTIKRSTAPESGCVTKPISLSNILFLSSLSARHSGNAFMERKVTATQPRTAVLYFIVLLFLGTFCFSQYPSNR